ncbi:MAG: FHA domain-containing protein [Armatimonadetes bacterium]|nr:FHA domain-containing protein [Armatimonadota bacterium]
MASSDDGIIELPSPDEDEQNEDIIEITHADLEDVALPPPPRRPSVPADGTPLGGPVSPLPEQMPKYKKGSVAEVATSVALNVLPLAVAGGLGGLLAWGILEPFVTDSAVESQMSVVLREMALFFGVLGACVGALIGAADGVTSANVRQALAGGGLGLVVGAGCGAFGGVFGQVLYSSLGGGKSSNPLAQLLVRAAGWAVVGAGVGIAPGVLAKARKKIINGLLGGLAGGAIGGFLFDPIGAIVGSGELSRLIGMASLGVAAGAAMGIVEQVTKQAWLVITGGPLTGKQFILYNPVTTVGRSYSCDIALVKDAALAELHCRIDRTHAQSVLLAHGPTFVNGRPVQRAVLRDGDTIQLGQTVLTYRERPVHPSPP